MIEAVSALSSFADRAASVSGPQSFAVQKTGAAMTSGAQAAMAPGAGVDFGDMMAQMATNAVDTVKAGEAAAISGIQSKASVQQVVQAVMTAEQSLQTAIAIRDKVVAAYHEITRMAI